ncbi:hypothetical protein J6590_038118 [Homalodisca vitripennis]|nr:hypothetical protein J6590_038118 [Homalodisca vitripennis]
MSREHKMLTSDLHRDSVQQKHTVQSEVTDGSGDPASADSATSAPDHTQLLCLDHLASCDNYSF